MYPQRLHTPHLLFRQLSVEPIPSVKIRMKLQHDLRNGQRTYKTTCLPQKAQQRAALRHYPE